MLTFVVRIVKLNTTNHTMAKKTAKQPNAKRVAYEKKEEQQGEKVIKWIIGVLIALAVVYAGYSIWIVS